MTTISDIELKQGLADVLGRVRHQGESFTVQQNGTPIALLTPANAQTSDKVPFTIGDFIALLQQIPRPDDAFADDLERIQAAQSHVEAPEWPI